MSYDRGPIFMPGEAVYYTGEKFKQELTDKSGKPYKGWIHFPVLNQPDVFAVEFPDLKEPDYIIHKSLLSKARPPKGEKHDGPEVLPPRRSRKPEET